MPGASLVPLSVYVGLLARTSCARGAPWRTVCGSLALSRWLIVRVYARALKWAGRCRRLSTNAAVARREFLRMSCAEIFLCTSRCPSSLRLQFVDQDMTKPVDMRMHYIVSQLKQLQRNEAPAGNDKEWVA